MRKIALLLILLLISGIFPVSVHAAGSVWTAWLFEQSTGRMTLVNNDGDVSAVITLPSTAGSQFSQSVAVSRDGNLIAYSTLYIPPGATDAAMYERSVSIFDYTVNAVIYTYMLDGAAYSNFDFYGSPLMFDETGSSLAFGYSDPVVGWQIVVIDLTVFDLFHLTATDTAVTSAGIEAGFGFLVPVVYRYDGVDITFSMIMAATEGADRYPAYVWNMPGASVTQNNAYIHPDHDTAPVSGEVVLALNDDRFTNSSYPETGFPVTNTLHFYDPLLDTTIPFVHTPTLAFYDPEFVQAGERIVTNGYDPATNTRRLSIFERSGVAGGSFDPTVTMDDVTSTAGLINGFIYTLGRSGTTLYYVETRGVTTPYSAVSVWNSALGAEARIAWTSDDFIPAVEPLMLWGRLAIPTADMGMGGGGAVSTALTIGGRASIFTTEGDTLRMRSGPGQSFAVIAQLANGTGALVLEGPTTDSNGLVWWRIQADTGQAGWVVEAIDGIRTLVPGP